VTLGPCTVQDWPYASFSGGATCQATQSQWSLPSLPPVDPEVYGKILDGVQLVLDGVGLIPGFGEAADALNVLISGLRGDYFGAALSVICMVPVAGYIGNALKAGRHLAPNGVITMLRALGEPVLKGIASATDELAAFMASLPKKLPEVLRSLRRWRFLSDEVYTVAERAVGPIVRKIDDAFAQIMGMIDEALNGPPGVFAMAGNAPPPPRSMMMSSQPPRPSRPSGGGGGGGGSAARAGFRQGDHLVNTGLRKVLDELTLLDGQGGRLISEARAILDDPDFLTTINKGAHGADANSVLFGRAAERVRTAASQYRQAKTPGEVAARALSLRAELRDMLNAAVDFEVAKAVDKSHVRRVQGQLIRVWSILDGAVARSTHASMLSFPPR
jgi:hypothetical protein